MTLQEAYYSGLRFRHKNWCESCWKKQGISLIVFIKNSSMTEGELFSDNWVVESFVSPTPIIIEDLKMLHKGENHESTSKKTRTF